MSVSNISGKSLAALFFPVLCLPALAFAAKVSPALSFTPVQPELFADVGGQAVAWADYDQDGDLDLAVGFRRGVVRLYQQDNGEFKRVDKAVGLSSQISDYRSLSWGDVNRDGFPDLFVGFGRDSGLRNQLYIGSATGFTEQAAKYGLDSLGTTRQSVWLDYDHDGDSDLFVAMRDRSSKFYRNDGEHFTDISAKSGLNDPRRSVAAVWLDNDRDGDLDLYLPNQSGDRDGFYQNNADTFSDIAAKLEIDKPRRSLKEGSVGATLCDVNNDGHMDMFVPVYGKDMLYIADGMGGFVERAAQWGVDAPEKAVSADCGDVNNDGLMDLYVVAYQPGEPHGYDHLYINQGGHFVDAFPSNMNKFDGDHGVRFADYDNDGDLDIAITNRHAKARHSVWRNELITEAANTDAHDNHHFIQITVLDSSGKHTRQGDEVRIYKAATKQLIGFGIVDTGGGYISQNIQPLHFGLARNQEVDIEISSMGAKGRVTQRLSAVQANQHIVHRLPR